MGCAKFVTGCVNWIACTLPLGGGESLTLVQVEGYPLDEKTSFESRSVTPRYFAAMGIPLIEGRVFDGGDAEGRERVILVSQASRGGIFPGARLSVIASAYSIGAPSWAWWAMYVNTSSEQRR